MNRSMPEDPRAAWQRIARHSPIALLLDFDGTLIPFAPTPAEALPDDEVLALLAALAAADGVTCTVVSGRQRYQLAAMLGDVMGLRLVAEHGMWRRGGGPTWEATVPFKGDALDRLEALLVPAIADVPGAMLERKSASLCIHYRLVTGSGRASFLDRTAALVDGWLASHADDYELLHATEAKEVRTRRVHKGLAVDWAREAAAGDLVCVAIGDDVTDEDMFAALAPGDAAILVGGAERPTAARWRLSDAQAVRDFLRGLLAARQGGEDGSSGWHMPAPLAPLTARPAPAHDS
jgi:trehalose-phosphatase